MNDKKQDTLIERLHWWPIKSVAYAADRRTFSFAYVRTMMLKTQPEPNA